MEEIDIVLCTKWKGNPLRLTFSSTTTILEIKQHLTTHTQVPPNRQKLVGLNLKGKPASDEISLCELKLRKPEHKFMLIGTEASKVFVDPSDMKKGDLPVVLDDFSKSYTMHSNEWKHDVSNYESLERVDQTIDDIHFIQPPRAGKKLLVLDLDHTILDFSKLQDHESFVSLKRPGMDKFLASAYEHYDLAIWSQTSWKWLEIKLTELSILTNPSYRICFVLDKTSMFDFCSTEVEEKRSSSSKKRVSSKVKPLKLIWKRFPEWNASNTLHIDDLKRNFAMNPLNGIRVSAWYRNREKAEEDSELANLAVYLVQHCAPLKDVTSITHSKWIRKFR